MCIYVHIIRRLMLKIVIAASLTKVAAYIHIYIHTGRIHVYVYTWRYLLIYIHITSGS